MKYNLRLKVLNNTKTNSTILYSKEMNISVKNTYKS